jgi:hypothetical protein
MFIIRWIFWAIVLCIFIVLFVFFGGGEYLKKFGSKAEDAGEKMTVYEEGMKDAVKKTKDTVEESREAVKKYMPDK